MKKINIVSSFLKKNLVPRNIIASICLMLFAVLLVSILMLSITHNLIPLIISVVFGISVAIYIVFFGKIKITSITISLALFIVYATLITCLISRNFSNLKTYYTIFILLFALNQFLLNYKRPFLVMIVFLFSFLFFSIVFLLDCRQLVLSFFHGDYVRAGSQFDNVNAVGGNFLCATIVILFCFLKYHPKKKVFFYTFLFSCYLLFSLCALLTGSRTAIIGLLLSVLTFLFLLLYQKHKIILFVIYFSIFVSIILFLTLPIFSSLNSKFLSLFSVFSGQSSTDQSTFNRMSMMISAFENWMKALFTGYGASGFRYVSSLNTYSHSTISDILVNFGIIGSLLYFYPQVVCLFSSNKGSNSKFFFILFVFGYLLIGLFGTVLLQRKIMYFLLAFGFSFFVNESSENIWFLECFIDLKNSKKRVVFKHNKGSFVTNACIQLRNFVNETK